MFGSRIQDLYHIHSFAGADRIWHKEEDHSKRRGAVGRAWSPNERSLLYYGNNQQNFNKYRLVRRTSLTGRVSYEAVLFRTAMAIWHEPDERGFELREFRSFPTTMSRQFFWRVTGFCGQSIIALDTEGVRRMVPVSEDAVYAKLVFTPSERLVVDESSHAPIGRPVVSPERKAARARLRKELGPYIDAMMFLGDGFWRDYEPPDPSGWRSYGKPFVARESAVGESTLRTQLQCCACYDQPYTLDAAGIDVLRGVAQCVYERAMDSREDRTSPLPVPTFRAALTRVLLQLAWLHKPDAKEPLPSFMSVDEAPSNFVFL